MLATRTLHVSKAISKFNNALKPIFSQQLRNSGGSWAYRVAPPAPPRRLMIIAEVGHGLMWWWILWHLCTEPEHIYGEWPIVEPLSWTDTELGIPPDSAGPAPRVLG